MPNIPKFNALDVFKPLRGKLVLLRVDLNSPIEKGKVQENPRFAAHAATIAGLVAKGAKVVLLAHQGRKGDKDFSSLKPHAAILGKLVGKKILFSEDPAVISQKTLASVARLKAGEIMLLDNVRYLDDEAVEKTAEEHAKSSGLVKALAPMADLFVDDAFSNAHRGHASMVGFCAVLPSAAGPVMVRELEGGLKARENAKRPSVYLLGGAKPDDVLKLMAYALRKGVVDKILTSGVIGELCLLARGSQLPASKMAELKKAGFLEALLPVRDLIHEFHEFIETPFDFAYADENGERHEVMLTHLTEAPFPTGDIGIKTSNKYSKIAARSATVYVKGPCGKYEEKPFENGTRAVFTAIGNSKAYTLVGGGHTLAAFEKFGIPASRLSHVSLGGGALLELMQGRELPAIKALELSAKKFRNKFAEKKGKK